jgi:hypothetical protein
MWLVSVVLVLGLVLGQLAEVGGSAEDHQPSILGVIADMAEQQGAPVPACDPDLTCFAFVVPDGSAAARSLAVASVSRPDVTRAQLRFGGPSVTLPPPRTLT